MSITELTVEYSRTLSDGNFGSEKLGFSMTVTASQEYFADDQFAAVAQSLRTAVLTELAKSAAPRVANAAKYELNPPQPRQLEPVPTGSKPHDLENLPWHDDDEEDPF